MGGKLSFTVLVSEDCRRFLAGHNLSRVTVRYTNQIRETVFQLLRDFTGRRFHLLLVVSAHQALGCHDLFKAFDPQRLQYTFAIMGSQDEDLALLENLSRVLDFRVSPPTAAEVGFLLKKTEEFFRNLDQPASSARVREAMNRDQAGDQEALISIGKALSLERDPDHLLRTILYMSKKITGADAGSIYIVEGKGEERRLRFKYSHTFSKDLPYEEFTLPIDSHSIAGYIAQTGETLNLEDVYRLGADSPVSYNDTFDKKNGYRCKSMLVTPMVNHLGQVIGVIQLINSKEAFSHLQDISGNEAFEVVLRQPEDFEKLVVPFEPRYVDLMKAVASQAAIAIENNRMIHQIQTQFEAFVRAAITAVESRDPATSGHSLRVTHMAGVIARAINEVDAGPLKDVYYTPTQLKELELASLLHDFGKVYIDLELFLKAKKLLPKDLEILRLRSAVLYRTVEAKYAQLMLDGGDRVRLESEKQAELAAVKTMWEKILVLNEPAVVSNDFDAEVKQVVDQSTRLKVEDFEGKELTVLTPKEIENLAVPRGSLNEAERKIIQSHVTHTFNFVKNIPWPAEYANIPDISGKHHEMLDGSGYPWGVKADDIPMGARIMAVADVFDALAASDRPYKKALPLEKILAILQSEADQGKLDKDIVKVFLDKQLFEIHGKFELTSPDQLPKKNEG